MPGRPVARSCTVAPAARATSAVRVGAVVGDDVDGEAVAGEVGGEQGADGIGDVALLVVRRDEHRDPRQPVVGACARRGVGACPTMPPP